MLKVPEAVAKASCTPVTAQRLGTPRITEAAYENPDGTPIDFAPDFFGTARSGDVIPGPFAGLLPGTYTFTVWNNNQ